MYILFRIFDVSTIGEKLTRKRIKTPADWTDLSN